MRIVLLLFFVVAVLGVVGVGFLLLIGGVGVGVCIGEDCFVVVFWGV